MSSTLTRLGGLESAVPAQYVQLKCVCRLLGAEQVDEDGKAVLYLVR